MLTSNAKFPPKNSTRTFLTDEQFASKVTLEKDNIKHYLSKLFKNNDSEMESLATTALQRAINKYKKYDGIDAIDTWLYGIVTNVAIDHIKEKRETV